jgi:proline dehydrogenase
MWGKIRYFLLINLAVLIIFAHQFYLMEKIFNDTQNAFALKSDRELQRAHFLFTLIQNRKLVKAGTALTNFALKFHLPVEGLIRSTVFDHFCGGTTEKDCLPVVARMFTKGVSSVLDYSVEGKEDEESFDNAALMTLKTLDFAKEYQAVPFAVFKPTGFGRFDLYVKVGEGKVLSVKEKAEWDRVVDRFDRVCKKAYENDIYVLVDGEESWMQDAADNLVTLMMQRYNKNKAIVFNTLQLYRHDRLDYLKMLHRQAEAEGFYIGMKLVRGAYMEKENMRAEELGYPTPICASKQATDLNFDAAVRYMMDNLERMAIFAGTHNEESCYKLIDLMLQKGISKEDPRIWFGQLYGMSDNISYNLAAQGYQVAKYLPFGPVREVMPYLIRRAEENTSVEGQTSRELMLIKAERARRKGISA